MMRIKSWVRNMVAAMPLVLVVGVAAFGVAAMVLLLIGKFSDTFVWPICGSAALIAMALAARLPRVERPGSQREQRWMDWLALVAVVVWGAWNITLTSQHIFTNRDPATYANAAAWLVNHDSLAIATPDFFKDIEGFTNDSPGFETFGGDQSLVSAQGQHVYPVLLGLAGRVVGQDNMFHMPVVIAMIALLAVYGFARLIVKPRWALLSIVALGATLPMLYFARDTYTEPLTMGLLFSGMTLVWIAHQTRRLSAWLLAGLVVGASAMTRIDAYISIAGIMLFIAIAMVTIARGQRKRYVAHVLGFLLVIGALSSIAFIDMAHFSMPYLAFHKGLIKQEILGLGLVIAASTVFVSLAWHTTLLTTWRRRFGQWQYVGLSVVILLVGLLLVSRPLWFTGHTAAQDPNIAALQARESLPIEPRSYTEQSTKWVTWYMGMPLAALGLAGLALASATAKRQRLVYLSGVSVIAVTALVYFVQPSVAPDQIWASRRYLPVVLPGLLVFAMVPLAYFWDKYRARLQLRPLFALIVVSAVLLAPLAVSRPFVRQRDVLQAPIITDMCKALPKNAAVLWVGDGQYYLVQPTRSFCNVPAFAFTSRDLNWKSIDQAAAQARAAGYQPVLAVMNGDKPILGKRINQAKQVSDATFKEMEMRLSGPPRFAETKTMGVSLLELP